MPLKNGTGLVLAEDTDADVAVPAVGATFVEGVEVDGTSSTVLTEGFILGFLVRVGYKN